MPSFLQVENLSKSYGPKILFENISFNINEGDKIALVAPNGTGKTTLLKILAGKDKSDSGGSIKFLKDINIAFLDQEASFRPDHTIREEIYDGDFDRELRLNRILTELGLNPDTRISDLSGGEIKRAALAQLLSLEAEFLILDEPTNHLDVDAIEYLEGYLKKSRCTLFMVTHDRYFLNRVCNTVMEMDGGAIYIYKGDYETFLEKREERVSNFNAQTDKVRNILRRELEWIHSTPCARSGKAKYRIQEFWNLKERASQTIIQRQLSMDAVQGSIRMGTKVIDCKGLTFAYGNNLIVKDFTYNFQRYEKVGIVGANGIGKSTFLDLLAYSDDTHIERGESLKIGFYRQEGLQFNNEDTVLDIVPDTRLLEKFLFPRDMYNSHISRLSGGEKRRLYLLTILMTEPNLLILDEPTNDLDIITLNIFEDYLLNFQGNLIIVTHDRHFLDRLADHLLVFCGDGQIKDFLGGYTEYRSFLLDLKEEKRRQERQLSEQQARKDAARAASSSSAEDASTLPQAKRKLSFKEKREMEELETRMEALNAEKAQLETLLAGGNGDYSAISEASRRYQQLKDELDIAEMRWLELSI